ncbi:tetratricopeptide repeat protein 23-like [Mercenaria mercenaria]|uniref:tetratricopeptide repeat protein 23-like n=1 Tax=Mercenaria mercenaria TaxID=6596 RepID=UPI00234F6D34|nr:tetratricopeptide repeat protein 23-like [Mercenaria mercenaria]
MKTVNGKKSVNMTPPDKLLEKANRMAKKLSAAKKADKAVKERIRILALTRIVYGSAHWKLAEAHVNLAEDYLELKGYNAQAEYHTENAMTIMLNSVTTTTTEREKADVFGVLFQINYIQGKAQIAMKKYSEADTALAKADRAYQACSKLSCVTDDQCDDMEIKLAQTSARLSWRQKKYAVAGSQYDKVIDLTKRRYGEDAIELIQLYQEGGRLEQSKGRLANHDKAIDMFLQAHSIAAANYKYASEEIVDTALALAQAYASTGREEAESSAESYLNECLSSCTTVYGPDHKKTLEVQDELARLLIRTERETDALEMLRSSLPLKNEVYGEYSENVADTHKLIASVHLAQGNIEKALRAYKKCLNIETLVLGKNHKKTKDSERTIDILMASPGLSKKFVLNKEDELKKRPRFNNFSKSAR